MTASEARAKFPNAHLYWYGSERCWNVGAAYGFRALAAVPLESAFATTRTHGRAHAFPTTGIDGNVDIRRVSKESGASPNGGRGDLAGR